jgi:hypothetical protein
MTIPPSPRYTLRQSPSGFYYLIPFIYEYGFEQWCKHEWKSQNGAPVPAYAKPVDLPRLTFEHPLEVPLC